MIRRRVVVTGRVQGVWFRESCKHMAETHGVAGWVRNRDDGTVEAVFEGGDAAVTDMVAWSHHGPGSAQVEHVEVHHEEPDHLDGFEVR